MHQIREKQSLEIHRRIAEILRTDPERVLGKARQNLRKWSAVRSDAASTVVFSEWLELLDDLTPAEVAEFLISESERAVRMRQSSPFAGVLSPQEVWAIKRACHEAA